MIYAIYAAEYATLPLKVTTFPIVKPSSKHVFIEAIRYKIELSENIQVEIIYFVSL